MLWGFLGEPLPAAAVDVLRRVGSEPDGRLGAALAEHLTRLEVHALREPADVLLATETFPAPNGTWPAIPRPAF